MAAQESYIESDNCVTRAVTASVSGYLAGAIAGAVSANWSDIPPVLRNKPWPALKRTGQIMGQYGVTFAMVGLTFAAAACAAEKSRGKKDLTNGVYGGAAAGAAMAARTHSIPIGVAAALAFVASSTVTDVTGTSFRGNGLVDDGATPRKRTMPYPGAS